MNNQSEEDNVGNTVWQSQVLVSPRISLDYVRHQAEKLNADFRRESCVAYAATATSVMLLLVVLFKSSAQIFDPFAQVMLLGSFTVLLATVYLTIQVHKRGTVLRAQAHEPVVHSLDAYRAELQRRRDLYLGPWRWSLWPAVPVLAVFFVGGMLYDQGPGKLARYGLAGVFSILWTLYCWWHYRRKGQQFQRELDALATLDKK